MALRPIFLSCVHSPMTLLSPFGPSLPSDRHVPTSWFHTTSPVYSAHQVSSLLHLETGKSSLRFQVLPPPSASRSQRLMGDGPLFPHARFTPFEEFPSPVAVPHHCGRCLLAVLSHRDRFKHRSARSDQLCVPTSAATSASLAAEAARAHLSPRPYADPH